MAPNRIVLLTGGAGFIGTHLCRGLVAHGVKVRVLDLRRPLEPVAGVEYRLGDVLSRDAVASALVGIDALYHLAATASVTLCEENPVETYRNNVETVCQVLQGVRAAERPIRVVFSSSAAVYGDEGNSGAALSELKSAVRPRSHYGMQKWIGEEIIRHYHRAHAIEAVTFRFFNVYGPGQNPTSPYSGVISTFASRLQSRAALRLDGGGLQSRDFVSVFDIVTACIHALGLDARHCNGTPINLATGTKVTIQELASTMMEVTGISVPLVEGPDRAGDIKHSLADLTRLRTIMGWAPENRLRERLAELMASLATSKAA